MDLIFTSRALFPRTAQNLGLLYTGNENSKMNFPCYQSMLSDETLHKSEKQMFLSTFQKKKAINLMVKAS